VELELGLVDQHTMALSSSIQPILEQVPPELEHAVKPELMQCVVEINTGVCRTVGEVERDLREKLQVVQELARRAGVRLWWGATMQHLPTLLALSCSSPFWEGRVTGLGSMRSKIMEGLPTAGLPTLMRNWSEYVWLVNHLVETGFINTIREIWWDVRPHHNFGTVEVRVCDMPGNLEDTLALTALIQCLVKALSDVIDRGAYQHDCHPMMVRQNKWRAARFGVRAHLVDSYTYEVRSCQEAVHRLVELLRPTARQLDCLPVALPIRPPAASLGFPRRGLRLLPDSPAPPPGCRPVAGDRSVRGFRPRSAAAPDRPHPPAVPANDRHWDGAGHRPPGPRAGPNGQNPRSGSRLSLQTLPVAPS